MSQQSKKKEFQDIFIADSIYPEADAIFKVSLKSLEEIKSECYVVLDTNVLLVPYNTGKESLAEIRKTYKKLITENRLIVPGQVAREFAKNRANKLLDLYQNLSKKRDKQIQFQEGSYPLLESLDKYQEIIRIENEIDKKIRDYRKAIGEVLDYIKEWQWNDPVSLMYAELFAENVVINLQANKEEVAKDLDRRQKHDIPPGYEDSSKPDKGVGDILIWHTIMEIGKTHKKSVIFVSGEKKADWWHKKNQDALYPRYELVDEFRRYSAGQSFHIIELSHLLTLYGANENVVEEIKQEEKQIHQEKLDLPSLIFNKSKRLEDAVYEAFVTNNLGKRILRNYPNFPDFIIENPSGIRQGVEVKLTHQDIPVSMLKDIIFKYKLTKQKLNLTSLQIVLVSEDDSVIRQWEVSLTDKIFQLREAVQINDTEAVQINDSVILVIGFLSSDGSFIMKRSVPL